MSGSSQMSYLREGWFLYSLCSWFRSISVWSLLNLYKFGQPPTEVLNCYHHEAPMSSDNGGKWAYINSYGGQIKRSTFVTSSSWSEDKLVQRASAFLSRWSDTQGSALCQQMIAFFYLIILCKRTDYAKTGFSKVARARFSLAFSSYLVDACLFVPEKPTTQVVNHKCGGCARMCVRTQCQPEERLRRGFHLINVSMRQKCCRHLPLAPHLSWGKTKTGTANKYGFVTK